MKPWGMTSSFEVVRSSRIEDAFYDAVSLAIDGGWSPTQVIEEIRHDWELRLAEKSRQDNAQFKAATK